MCGIVAVVDNKRGIDPDCIRRVNSTLEHRGPDSRGIFVDRNVALGANRLKIHDLTSASDQPFTSACGSYVIVYNGAIYNYRDMRSDLKKKGIVFQTDSDTEVLLSGFIHGEVDFVRRLEGMFAFVIYDKIRRRLFVCRDHIGIKPLHIYRKAGLMIVSSEIKPILSYPGVEREVNYRIIPEYFCFQHVQPPDTFFKDIDVFPPGSWMCVSVDGVETGSASKYWRFDVSTGSGSDGELVETILEKNLASCWKTDRNTGIQLSGGVDSSLVVAMSKKKLNIEEIDTYSVIFDDSTRKYYKPRSEEEYIRLVLEKYTCRNQMYLFEKEAVRSALPNSIWYHEAPLHGPSTSLYYLLAKEIRKYIAVVITGEGADDIFLGYFNGWDFKGGNPYFKFFVPLEMVEKMFRIGDENDPLRKKKELLDSVEWRGMNDIQKTSAMTITSVLHGLLARHDRMFMSQGIEGRPPFCSRELIECRFGMDDSLVFKNGIGKYVIKKLAEQYFSSSFVHREKIGFSVPFGDWLSDRDYWGDYWRLIDRDWLAEVMDLNIFDSIIAMPDSPRKWSGANLNTLCCVLNLQLWYLLFFDTRKYFSLLENGFEVPV
jgi:asparagine synthase (glutamine-hydrolysing)